MIEINDRIVELYIIIEELEQSIVHFGMKGDVLNNGRPNTILIELKTELQSAQTELLGLLQVNSNLREHGGLPSIVDD